jgi:chromosome segregation ATPase
MSAEAQETMELRDEPETTESKGKESRISDLPENIRDYIRALRRENKEYRERLKMALEEVQKLKPLAEKAGEIEEKYNKIVEKQREKLLAKLPEDKRDKYKDWDIVQLETIVEDFLAEQEKRQSSPGVVQGRPLPQKDFAQMTQDELLELKLQNPEVYERMKNEFFNKKYNILGG